jgi:hypothetical protein
MCGCAESRWTWLCDVAQVIRPFCLAGNDGLVRDGLVGVASEQSCDPAVLWVAADVQPCPAVVGFLLEVKPEPEIPILHVIPRTVASLGGICVEPVNILSKIELRAGSNPITSPERVGVGTAEKRRSKSPDPVRLLGGEGVQGPHAGGFGGAPDVWQTKIGFPIVVQIERNRFINPNRHLCRPVDDLRFGRSRQGQCSDSGGACSKRIHVEPEMDESERLDSTLEDRRECFTNPPRKTALQHRSRRLRTPPDGQCGRSQRQQTQRRRFRI